MKEGLNLVEISIIFTLKKQYPRYTPIKELAPAITEYAVLEKNMNRLLEKGLVEQRWGKYRVTYTDEKTLLFNSR